MVLGASLANDYQSAAFSSDAQQAVAFFRSIDDAFGAVSSFLTAVGLIAMLWFTIGLALLLRRYDGDPRWRSAFLAGAGGHQRCLRPDRLVGRRCVPGARHRPASGPIRLRPRQLVVRERLGRHWGRLDLRRNDLPLGQRLAELGRLVGGRRRRGSGARAIWTNDLVFVAFTAFWLWVAVVSVLLLTGRLAVAETY